MKIKRYKKVDDKTISKWNQIEEQARKNKEDKERAQKLLRERMYNSSITKEIVEFILREENMPYAIKVDSFGLKLHYEDLTKSYIFRSHELPNLNKEEEVTFAYILNEKLNNKYIVSDNDSGRQENLKALCPLGMLLQLKTQEHSSMILFKME